MVLEDMQSKFVFKIIYMKRLLISALATLIALSALAKTQKVITYDELKDFKGLDISSVFKVTLKRADTYSVKITIDDDKIEANLDVFIKNGILNLAVDYDNIFTKVYRNIDKYDIRAEICMPNIEYLNMSGASSLYSDTNFNISDFKGDISGASHVKSLTLHGKKVSLELSGAADVDMDLMVSMLKLNVSGASDMELNASEVKLSGDGTYLFGLLSGEKDLKTWEIEASGASSIELSGMATNVNYECSGASSIDAEDFVVANASVEASGASSVEAYVYDSLDVDISGASSLKYFFDSKKVDLKITNISVSRAASLKEIHKSLPTTFKVVK